MAAEMLLPTRISFALGSVSGTVETTAVVLFMLVLYRTARQSIEPHNPYEKFIASSFLWLLLGTILEAVFFFGKATAHSEHGMIMRIALIDFPLRDIPGVARLRGPDHRRSQPALCAARLWSGELQARSPDADFLVDQWQLAAEHR